MLKCKSTYGLLLGMVLFFSMLWPMTSAGRSMKIKEIIFHGVRQLSQEEAKTFLGLQPNATIDPADLIKHGERLLRGYAEKNHYFTKIDSILYRLDSDSTAEVHIFIQEDHPLRLGELNFSGIDSSSSARLKSRFESKIGRPFELTKMEADIDDALQQIEKEGHPFCRFELKQMTLDSLSPKYLGLNLDWKVVYGPQVYLREILVQGNKITKPQVIYREIRMRPNDRYDPAKVARVVTRLMKTGYFTRVAEPEIYLSSGQDGGMFIEVEEGNTSRFDGVIGYNPAKGTTKGYITGLIDISFGNLFGTGRTLQAHWQKRDQHTQDIKIYYREPWVLNYPVHLGFGFMQLIQDTTYVQREILADIDLPLYENLSATAQLNRVEVSPDSVGSYRFGLLHTRTFSAAFGIRYDSRDDRVNPQRGIYYQTMLQNGSKRNYGPQDLIQDIKKSYHIRRVTLDFEWYIMLFKRQVLAWSLHGGQITSNEKQIPLPDQFRLGGAKTLRGYREDQFRGTEVAWTSLEYRYWMGRRSRAFLFADYGYYGYKKETTHTGRFKLGYGFGFRLQTGLGIMGIDYGLGRGDDPLNGKIHVGLINEF